MASARSFAGKPGNRKSESSTGAIFSNKRAGAPSQVEKDFVAQFVADQPGGLTTRQENALATALRRPRDTVRKMLDEAREIVAGNTVRYANIHLQAAEDALASDSMMGKEVAGKLAQWALTNASLDGKRVIDKAASENTGTKIIVGVKIGGVNQEAVPKETLIPMVQITEGETQ